MNTYYVYIHIDPITGLIRYVGKGHETGITYPSIREAAKQLGLNEQKIYRALKKNITVNEFTFSYELPEIVNLCY